MTKEVANNKEEIVKTASNALNLNVGFGNHSSSEFRESVEIVTQADQTEAMSKVFGMFGEGKSGKISKDKLGDALRLADKLLEFYFPTCPEPLERTRQRTR